VAGSGRTNPRDVFEFDLPAIDSATSRYRTIVGMLCEPRLRGMNDQGVTWAEVALAVLPALTTVVAGGLGWIFGRGKERRDMRRQALCELAQGRAGARR
jgi:hypothetical protein